MEIQPIQGVTSTSQVTGAGQGPATRQPAGFADVFTDVVRHANKEQLQADQALTDFSTGKTDDVQAVVMSAAKADLSFRFFLEMRNKLTESYQELSRMQF